MKDINYILEMIPHRYPFLLVDRIIDKKDKKEIKTLKNVTINEPFFSGHFPEKPIMPGVLILESMAQSACLIILDFIKKPENHLVYLSKVNNLKIYSNVIPGDQIIIDAKVVNEKLNSFKFESTCSVNDKLVAKAEFLASMVERQESKISKIHQTNIISSSAKIGNNVEIGPYNVIEDNVIIGDNVKIGNFNTISQFTEIGNDCNIINNSSIGAIPQDKKFGGEDTKLIIGDRTIIREFVTLNRGTKATGETRIGEDVLIMTGVHVAHDCIIGNNVIFANNATLAGHVEVGDWAIFGGFTGAHQFTKIGAHSFIGMNTLTTKDIPAYVMAEGQPIKPRGVNIEGLKRRDFTSDQIKNIKNAYRILYRKDLKLSTSIIEIEVLSKDQPELKILLDSLQLSSERGIIR